MKQKTILFVDNSASYLDVHAELLAKRGYRVYRAYSLAEAEAQLEINHVHLIILDVRMEDDRDEQDVSGLYWAEQDRYQPIPKVILSAHPSFELAVKALGPRVDGLPSAVNFVGKDAGIEAITEAVERVFADHIQINWQLDIRWPQDLSLSSAHLVSLIEPELENIYLSSRMEELEDLFSMLFHDSYQINIQRLFTAGKSKASLAVYAFSEAGLLSRYVVVCGLREAVQREAAAHHRFASKTATEGSTAKAGSLCETTHYGVVAYTLTNAQLEEVETLAEFYRRNQPEAIVNVMNYLFSYTLARYHEQSATTGALGAAVEAFLPYYTGRASLTRSRLEACITALQAEVKADEFAHFDSSMTALLIDIVEANIPIEAPMRWGIVHGDLTGGNILVDQHGRAWIIDFAGFDSGPLIQAFVTLEAAIKFDLAGDLNYQDRKKLEEMLHLGPNAEQDLVESEGTSAMIKALTVVNAIRRRALQEGGQPFDIYRLGLLLRTVERLTAYEAETCYLKHELAVFVHALNSIRENCKQLAPPPPVFDKPHSPWLDEDKPGYEVWIEGRWINLAEMEYKLLLVLYDQAVHNPENPRCTFNIIGRGVWGNYERLRDYSNIQNLIRRVRERIQPDGDDAFQYIENIRGVGYSLNLNYHQPRA